MTTTASLVQTLHRINRQKADLQGQLRRGPMTVAGAQSKLKIALDHVQSIREQITRSKLDADSKQLQMREREAKIHKWEGMLNAAKENREYQALKEQIAADRKANEVLSDEILEILESIDALHLQLADGEGRVEELQRELQKIQDQVQSRKLVLESDLSRVLAELELAEKNLTGDFKRDYDRLVASKGEDAMAELDGRCCSGCSQSLTPTMLDRLLLGHAVVCPTCGRLVYRSQDS